MDGVKRAGRSGLIRASVILAIALPSMTSTHSLAQDALNGDAVHLKAGVLMKALASANTEERERGRIYLLGVADAAEGTVWCGYERAKTVTIRSIVYDALKQLDPAKLAGRASTVILESLTKTFPCRRP